MFDIGWSELLVIAIVLIVVVGPKDLPPMIRAFGKTMAGLRKIAGEFRSQFDEALREAEMDDVRKDVRKTVSEVCDLNPAASLREAMNPLRQLGADLSKAIAAETPDPAPAAAKKPDSALPAASAAALGVAKTSRCASEKRPAKAKASAVTPVESGENTMPETARKDEA